MERAGTFMMFGGAPHTKAFSMLKTEIFVVQIHNRVIQALVPGQEGLPGPCADLQKKSNGLRPLMKKISKHFPERKISCRLCLKRQELPAIFILIIHRLMVFPIGTRELPAFISWEII